MGKENGSYFNMSVRLLAVAAMLVLLLSGVVAQAQENTGSIRGTVKDQSGAVVPGAAVTATSPALVRPIELVTDSAGVYIFPRLPVGAYTITAAVTGFKTVKKEAIDLRLGAELTLDLALTVGSVAETITVKGESEAVDVTSSKTSVSITQNLIDMTPKGRSFNSILTVAPGVIFDSNAGSVGGGMTGTSGNNPAGGVGGYSVTGASGSENNFVIDGVDVSNVRNGVLGRESAIPFEFIAEVQVKSGGFEAEYGGAVGGVVNVITKSGSNNFHGEGAIMFTSAGMNSGPRGTWRRDPRDATMPQYFDAKEDEYQTYYPGFSLGGPIFKDRLHFFSSYFPQLSRTQRSINYVTGGARTSSQRTTRHYAINRLDYAPTQKIQINTSYMWNPIRLQGLLLSSDPLGTIPANDQSIGGGYTPASEYSASFAYTPTSKWIVSARYGYKYLNDKGNTYGLPTAPWLIYQRPTSGQTTPPVPASLAGPSGYQNVSSTFQVLRDITTRHNVYLDSTYLTRLFGQQHSFKFGYAINRIANEVEDDFINGQFNFYWGEGFTRGSKVNERGTYGYYIWEDGVRHNSQASSRNQGFYIQDAWQIHRHVTLNVGVRFENEFLPPYIKEVNGKQVPNPVVFNWGDKIAPRIGGAWDVLGNGKWKVSGSFGMFYDTMKYELARSSFGGEYWFSNVYKLDTLNLASVNKQNPGALGALIIRYDNRSPAVNAQGQLDGIDPAIKPMLSREFSVASEHRLTPTLTASMRYSRKRLVRGMEDIGVLDAEDNEVYTIGNPGFGVTDDTKYKAPNGQPLTPRAVRNYDGIEFRIDHRITKGPLKGVNYFASYTYSRLWGNWAGLANSDEAGRSQPSVSRAFDLTQGNFDDKGMNVYGFLATDRPHVLKLFPSYELKTRAGTSFLSLSQFISSGTPISSTVTYLVPVFFNGRGDLGRGPTYTQTDALIAHTVNLTEGTKVRFDANVTNLFNQAIVTNYNITLNRNGNLPITTQDFFNGFDPYKYVNPNGINPATGKVYPSPNLNPVYKLPSTYQGGREIRLGVHFLF